MKRILMWDIHKSYYLFYGPFLCQCVVTDLFQFGRLFLFIFPWIRVVNFSNTVQSWAGFHNPLDLKHFFWPMNLDLAHSSGLFLLPNPLTKSWHYLAWQYPLLTNCSSDQIVRSHMRVPVHVLNKQIA